MSKVEIVERTIESKDSPVMPYHITAFAPMAEKVRAHFGATDLDAIFGNYLKWSSLKFPMNPIGPDLARDEFGVIWRTNPNNRGNVIEHPMKEPDLRLFEMPEYPFDQMLETLRNGLAQSAEYYNVVWSGDLLERALMLRGMVEGLVDLYENPEFMHSLLEKLTQIVLAKIRTTESLDNQAVFLSDDYGCQRGLMIGRGMWLEFIKPHFKTIVDCAHECGKKFFLHSDGDISELIPDFIELGVDVLHPMQPEAMDLPAIRREYGKDICFYGGIGTQGYLRSGTPEDVVREIRALKSVGPSFILAPVLQLLEDIPFENVLAMLDVLRES